MVGRPTQFPAQLVVRVSTDVREALDQLAAERNIRIGEVTREAIDIGLAALQDRETRPHRSEDGSLQEGTPRVCPPLGRLPG